MDQHQARYVHQRDDWPNYHWQNERLSERLAQINFKRGALVTAMATLGFEVRQEAVLSVLIQDIQKSSEIEGELLDATQLRSSIARRLGMDVAGLTKADRSVDGVVEMMLDATQRYDAPLDSERVFGWHSALFPTGRSGMYKITVGDWRDDLNGPMQVVSGPLGKEKVHYEAPEANRLPYEMERFFTWFESESMDPVLKAAIAHLWFVTVHPLDDGNGRIGRAIMDMALARADETPQRFYSMSAQIHKDKDGYYDVLERSQKASMDATPWLTWFLSKMELALKSADDVLAIVRAKQAFWDSHRNDELNDRQIKVINILFEGFNGKLRTDKYAKLTKCSKVTAWRDLTDLVERGILTIDGEAGGRSTSYILA